jgi:hypothetical protein
LRYLTAAVGCVATAVLLIVICEPTADAQGAPPDPTVAMTGGARHGTVVGVGPSSVRLGAHGEASTSATGTSNDGGGGPPCRALLGVDSSVVRPTFTDIDNAAAGGLAAYHQLQGERPRFALFCHTADNLWTFSGVGPFQQPGGGPAPAETAELALSQIVVPAPGIRTAPALELTGLVGIATWLWVEPTTWRPLSASASAGGLTVTATVTPTSVTWDMGEGRGTEPVVCDGPGTPYRLDVADSLQRTDCSYTFQWASTDHRRASEDGLADDDDLFHASATVTWSVRWVASNGESGALASITSTTSFDLRVGEVQAVVCYETDLSECAG